MSDQFIQVPPNSTGLKVDASELTVGANTVERQRIVLADSAAAAGLAVVENIATTGAEYGLVVREANKASVYHVVAAASTNTANIKASAGQVFGWHIFNNAQYPVFVKLFNKASAPTLGTDTPLMTIGVQAGDSCNLLSNAAISFSTGLSLAITKVITDADATAVAANDCVADIFYA